MASKCEEVSGTLVYALKNWESYGDSATKAHCTQERKGFVVEPWSVSVVGLEESWKMKN